MKLNFVFVARQYLSCKMPYYAVYKGRKPGIYTTWNECSAQVNQFSGSVYKKFATEKEAKWFITKRILTPNFGYKSVPVDPSIGLDEMVEQLCRKRKSSESNINTLTFSKMTISNDGTNESFVQPDKKRKTTSDADLKSDRTSEQDDKIDFITDEDGYVDVFTDGACSSNGYENARAGIGVWFQDNHPLNVSGPVDGRPTNNMAEIQAVTVAARQAKKAGIKKLRINTDSKFLISCIKEWMPKWKKRGWMTIDKKPVKNKTELLEMEKELESLIVAWNHVNGHVGIHGNEMADKLARAGCLRYKSQDG